VAQFDACVAFVLANEGGLSENPSDPGGCSNFGISLRFLREVEPDTLKRIGISAKSG
jgi:lysozyme family protein